MYNPALRAYPLGIGGGREQNEGGAADPRRQMHRPGIIADGADGAPRQIGDVAKAGPIGQVDRAWAGTQNGIDLVAFALGAEQHRCNPLPHQMPTEPGEAAGRGPLLRAMRRPARNHQGVGRRQAETSDITSQPAEIWRQRIANSRDRELLGKPFDNMPSVVGVVPHVMRAASDDAGPLHLSAEGDDPIKDGRTLVALQIVDAIETSDAQQPRQRQPAAGLPRL